MAQIDQTAGEVLDSLTGQEEMWIFDQFDKPIGELANLFLTRHDPGPYWRALIFIIKRREGLNEDDARNQVMAMRLKDVLVYFADRDSDEAEESGKDEPEPPSGPEPSPTSSSPLD